MTHSQLLRSSLPGTAFTWQKSLLVASGIALFSGCHSMHLTGQQIDALPEKQEVALGAKAYQDVLQTHPKSKHSKPRSWI